MERRRPAATADERTMLAGWFAWQQQTVARKTADLTDDQARRSLLTTSPTLTIAGLVSHLTSVERDWLEGSFLGHPDVLASSDDGWSADGRTLPDLLRAYRDQNARTQQILRDHELDELEAYAPPGLELVSLRWIVTHLIEETGRHLGHLDLLRELIDGSRGQ